MSRKYTKHTSTFTAHSEGGREFSVHIFTDYDQTASFGAGTNRVEGPKTLRTPDGDLVERIDKGKYRILGVEKIDIFSDDPNAP